MAAKTSTFFLRRNVSTQSTMDFNQGSNLKQAKTKDREDRVHVLSSKITNTWTAKPIKEEKDRTYLHNMVRETVQSALKKRLYLYLFFQSSQKTLP